MSSAEGDELADFGYRRIPAKEKPGYVQRHFAAIAARYDFLNSLLSLGLHRLWKRKAVAALGPAPGERVLDLCGGTGDLARLAATEVGPGGRVVLCDFSRPMIEAGLKLPRPSPAAPILAVQGDAEALPFAPGCFNAALVGFGLRNLTHMEQGLAELHRVLKAKGRLLCLEFSLPKAPWFRPLYDLYSFGWMPLAGGLLAGNGAAYRHLAESIRRFPPPGEVAALLEGVGFTSVTHRPLTLGIVTIYQGVKG